MTIFFGESYEILIGVVMDSALMLGLKKKIPSYEGFEFLGELSDSSVIAYQALSSAMGLSVGIYPSPASGWLSCKLDGKDLFVAKQLVLRNITWDDIYRAGLVYGIDGTGSNPSSTPPVNQLKTIQIKGADYKVRLLRGSNSDPAANESGLDLVSSRASEFSRIFYPLVVSDVGITSYAGPKMASYAQAQLMMNYRQWCMEATATWRICRGTASTARTDRVNPLGTSDNTVLGWRPVLEKV